MWLPFRMTRKNFSSLPNLSQAVSKAYGSLFSKCSIELQNVQERDATDDATSNADGSINTP